MQKGLLVYIWRDLTSGSRVQQLLQMLYLKISEQRMFESVVLYIYYFIKSTS